MVQAKKTFLIGFSGGADSTAALLWVLENPVTSGHRAVAIHFNHHLRGIESDAEAAYASGFAADCGVESRVVDLHIPAGGNLEARARQARLEAWKKLCREYENPIVVTGHHQDDCIENMFLRIGRGSNISGLTGLQIYSEVAGVRFFRPLLIMSRGDIEKFLRDRGVEKWVVDSSNLKCDYSRNVLRNRILPELYRLFPGGRKAVAATLENLSYDAAFIDGMALTFYRNSTEAERRRTDFWKNQDRAMTVRMLRRFCKELFNDDAPLTAAAVERFENMMHSGQNGICVLDETRKLRISGKRIHPAEQTSETVLLWTWRREKAIRWGNWRFTVKEIDRLPGKVTPFAACFNAAELPEILEIGAPQTGEVMLPFGRKNPVKIKELRIKGKVPAYPVNPVLRIPGGKALWLPGIRHSGECLMRPGEPGLLISGEKTEDFK